MSSPRLSADPLRPSYRRLDVAYGCFVGVAFTLLLGPVLWILPIDQGDKEGFAMLLGVPFLFAGFIAGVAGLVLSLRYWREWPLLLMTAASGAFVLAMVSDEPGIETMAAVYLAILLLLCGRWFLFRRRAISR